MTVAARSACRSIAGVGRAGRSWLHSRAGIHQHPELTEQAVLLLLLVLASRATSSPLVAVGHVQALAEVFQAEQEFSRRCSA